MLYTDYMNPFKWLRNKSSNLVNDDENINNVAKDWVIPIDLLGGLKVDLSDSRFVSLREALESQEYNVAKAPLSFPVGKDETGKFLIADFHKLPHIMAAGQTGSGKSSFTEGALIASLIYRNTPEDLRLILVDPKMVQFSQYKGIPHLQRPIIYEPDKAKEAIEWLIDEMKNRFDIFAESETRNIDTYNASGKGHMPYILLVIDEVSDLMMFDGTYFEKAFITLLQKARAVGIHIYIGTSSLRKAVLPGMLRANFATKIAFTTSSSIESKIIIDEIGAEKLQGRGDLLLSRTADLRPVHLQAPYLSEEEQAALADFIINNNI